MSWDPGQYLQYSEPRLRPARDLLARIPPIDARSIYDLGCGTGNVTRLLSERWPAACVTGVDDAPDMLARARAQLPTIRWVEQSIANWRADAPPELIFSNAALHWLSDHETLFLRLIEALAPAGILAVQMPHNFHAPSHTAMHDVARDGRWHSRLVNLLGPAPVHDAHFYYSLLEPHVRTLDIWQTEYLHVLEGEDAVKEWAKGTWLKRFLLALPEGDRTAFEAEYARRVRAQYPPRPDGRTLFPFRRLFIVARAKR